MQTININTSKPYSVLIGSGLLHGSVHSEKIRDRNVMVVSDDTVYALYGKPLCSLLKRGGAHIFTFVFPHGEQSKNLSTYGKLLEEMCRVRMTRNDLLVALGGGVTGDMAGFAAGTYQRGIDFAQIPTTLLSAVDSSVGGKTGVDLESGKNMVGVFHQPSHVLCDTDTLLTLPEDEYKNGCAEIIKYAMIGSRRLFQSIKEVPVSDQYENVISECVTMKRDLVEKDEFDNGPRMLLNFGHTVGHAVETCSGYKVPHGKAVAIGMAVITRAAEVSGLCSKDTCDKLLDLLASYGLPTDTSCDLSMLSAAIMTDKKSRGGKLTLVVPREIGSCELMEIPKSSVPEWLKAGGVR